MNKIIALCVGLLASTQLMAWEIPVQNCRVIETVGQIGGSNRGGVVITEQGVDNNYAHAGSSLSYATVECSGVVLKDAGRLYIDIGYKNPNTVTPVSCRAKAYKRGAILEQTKWVDSGLGVGGTIKIRHETGSDIPEIVRVFCRIPPIIVGAGIHNQADRDARTAYINYIRVF